MDIVLGFVISVINGVFHKYYVSVKELGDDSQDQLNRTPIKYFFSPIKTLDGNGFAVKISSMLLDRYFEDPTEQHHASIRFGLSAKKANPNIEEFLFTSSQYEDQLKKKNITGRNLRQEILKFIFEVNYESPNEGVSVFDLLDNIKADKEDVEGWIKNLYNQEYIIQLPRSSTYWQERGPVNANPFRINPMQFEKIQTELEKIEQNNLIGTNESKSTILAFISYSYKNKRTAGIIYKLLKYYGIDGFLAHEDIRPLKNGKSKL